MAQVRISQQQQMKHELFSAIRDLAFEAQAVETEEMALKSLERFTP
jgi:hypothetical protein